MYFILCFLFADKKIMTLFFDTSYLDFSELLYKLQLYSIKKSMI